MEVTFEAGQLSAVTTCDMFVWSASEDTCITWCLLLANGGGKGGGTAHVFTKYPLEAILIICLSVTVDYHELHDLDF